MSSIKKDNITLTLAISAILSAPGCKPIAVQPQPVTPTNQGTVQSGNQQDKQSTAFSNSQYTYDDAALLANFWGTASPWDAKLKIGSLLMNGNNSAVQQALNNARKNQAPAISQEQQQVNAFGSKYTYDDAALLANFWGTASVWDAKIKIGGLMLRGDDAAVQQALSNAQNRNVRATQEEQQINAFGSKYTYNDAALLANFWGTASVWDAKLKIGRLLMNGNGSAIQQALRNAQGI